jgi:hypothetical protein
MDFLIRRSLLVWFRCAATHSPKGCIGKSDQIVKQKEGVFPGSGNIAISEQFNSLETFN